MTIISYTVKTVKLKALKKVWCFQQLIDLT